MKITVSKEFDSIDEAQAFLDQFTQGDAPVVEGTAPAAPKRRGRPRKAASVPQSEPITEGAAGVATVDVQPAPAPAPAPVVTATAIDAPAPTGGAVSRDDAMKALRGLFNTKGEAAATDVLKSFGAASFGQVPAEKYGELVAAVNAKLA